MAELSPIFQAEALRIIPKLEDYIESLESQDAMLPDKEDLETLELTLEVLDGDLSYAYAYEYHGIDNGLMADILHRYDIISESLKDSIKFGVS